MDNWQVCPICLGENKLCKTCNNNRIINSITGLPPTKRVTIMCWRCDGLGTRVIDPGGLYAPYIGTCKYCHGTGKELVEFKTEDLK